MRLITPMKKHPIINSLAIGAIVSGMFTDFINSNVHAATVNRTVKYQANNQIYSESYQAETNARIKVPKGYSLKLISAAARGKISKHNLTKIKKLSREGALNNHYADINPADKRVVDITHLSKSDKVMLTKFTLSLVNQVRRQEGLPAWHYDSRVMSLANDIANEYTTHDRSICDRDHYFAGINRQAKRHGLTSLHGNYQIYEDEAGLPFTSDENHMRSIKEIKEGLYYNIKQMIFGGYVIENNNLSSYTEWGHTSDLMSRRKKGVGLAFSYLKNDPRTISVHLIEVANNSVLNYRTYNHMRKF